MLLPDWNRNGKRDLFDTMVDIKICEDINKKVNKAVENIDKEKVNSNINSQNINSNNNTEEESLKGISMGGKVLYDATKDSDGIIALKCFGATAILIAGFVFPISVGVGKLGMILSIFSSIGVAMLLLKNT